MRIKTNLIWWLKRHKLGVLSTNTWLKRHKIKASFSIDTWLKRRKIKFIFNGHVTKTSQNQIIPNILVTKTPQNQLYINRHVTRMPPEHNDDKKVEGWAIGWWCAIFNTGVGFRPGILAWRSLLDRLHKIYSSLSMQVSQQS